MSATANIQCENKYAAKVIMINNILIVASVYCAGQVGNSQVQSSLKKEEVSLDFVLVLLFIEIVSSSSSSSDSSSDYNRTG